MTMPNSVAGISPGLTYGVVPPRVIQIVTITGTGGTFTLALDDQTTATIAHNPSAADLQSDLEALSNVGEGNVTVTGTNPFTVTLSQPRDVMLVADTSGLTGGTVTIVADQMLTSLPGRIQDTITAALKSKHFDPAKGDSVWPGVGAQLYDGLRTGIPLPLAIIEAIFNALFPGLDAVFTTVAGALAAFADALVTLITTIATDIATTIAHAIFGS